MSPLNAMLEVFASGGVTQSGNGTSKSNSTIKLIIARMYGARLYRYVLRDSVRRERPASARVGSSFSALLYCDVGVYEIDCIFDPGLAVRLRRARPVRPDRDRPELGSPTILPKRQYHPESSFLHDSPRRRSLSDHEEKPKG